MDLLSYAAGIVTTFQAFLLVASVTGIYAALVRSVWNILLAALPKEVGQEV
jgi:hypothetical protein